jgi:hypothetical protein
MCELKKNKRKLLIWNNVSEEQSQMSALLKVSTAMCETVHDHFSSDFYLSLTFILISHFTLFVVEMMFLFNKWIGENRRGKEQRYTNTGCKVAVGVFFFLFSFFFRWQLIIVGIQYGSCFASPFRRLEFWGVRVFLENSFIPGKVLRPTC